MTENLKTTALLLFILALYGFAGTMDYDDAVKAEAAQTASAQYAPEEIRLAMKGGAK